MDTAKISFLKRERHQSELLDVRVTALTSDLALMTQIGIWENWLINHLLFKAKKSIIYTDSYLFCPRNLLNLVQIFTLSGDHSTIAASPHR